MLLDHQLLYFKQLKVQLKVLQLRCFHFFLRLIILLLLNLQYFIFFIKGKFLEDLVLLVHVEIVQLLFIITLLIIIRQLIKPTQHLLLQQVNQLISDLDIDRFILKVLKLLLFFLPKHQLILLVTEFLKHFQILVLLQSLLIFNHFLHFSHFIRSFLFALIHFIHCFQLF